MREYKMEQYKIQLNMSTETLN